MAQIEKLMVGLDFSAHDEVLVKTAKYINLVLRPELIDFVHIQNSILIPPDILEEFPALDEALEKHHIKEMVEGIEQFNIVGTEINYHAGKGNPFTQLLKKSHERGADLLLIGKKNEFDLNIMPAKFARKVNTNLLIVPPNTPEKVKTILVALDFSDYSRLALEYAIAFAEKSDSKIICQHVYQVPTGYSKIGKSYEEFASIMKSNAQKEYDRFFLEIPKTDCVIEPLFTLNDKRRVSLKINEAAEEINADLVIMGARGRTDSAALLLGSVTEQLVQATDNNLLMIVRKKDKTFGLWDALKSL